MAGDQALVRDAVRRATARHPAGGMRAALMAAGLVLCIGACTPVYRNHGYVPIEQDLALVEVGRDTRDTVAEKVGRPSAAGLLNDMGWYYVQSRYKHLGGREAVEIDRQVLAISFDEGGTVTNIERFGLQDGRVVPISRRVTETNIKGISVLQQLFKNFGRIGTEQLLDE